MLAIAKARDILRVSGKQVVQIRVNVQLVKELQASNDPPAVVLDGALNGAPADQGG